MEAFMRGIEPCVRCAVSKISPPRGGVYSAHASYFDSFSEPRAWGGFVSQKLPQ